MSEAAEQGAVLFLKLHGQLLKQLSDGGVQLMPEGRLYVVTFLWQQQLLTAEDFEKARRDAATVGVATIAMIAAACEKWLNTHIASDEKIYEPTDLSSNSLRALLSLFIFSCKNFEASLRP